MNPRYPFVAERAGHVCEYCRAPEVIFNFPFEVEHVVPQSQNGSDDEANLALACRACNLFKTDRTAGSSGMAGGSARLFNPRQDRWEVHFEVRMETGEIVGLTRIGVATIGQLQMNREIRCNARKLWMKLGLFPVDASE